MKKNLIFAALAAMVMSVAFVACSQDEDIAPIANNSTVKTNVKNVADGKMGFVAITNNPSATRGYELTAASQVANFQVFGFLEDGTQYVGSALNSGIMIDGDDDGEGNYSDWDYRTASDVAYWPQAWVRFQAIYPAEDASFSIESTDKATGVDFTAYAVAGTEDDGEEQKLTAVVTVPTTVTAQKDIMFAKAASNGTTHTAESNPAVALTFDHAMSQVVFQGKVASDKIAVEINDIKLKNIKQIGKVGYFGTDQALSATTTGYANTDYSIGLVATPTLGSSDVSTAKNLTAATGALFMLPQTGTAWTHTAPNKAVADAAGTSSADGQGILAISCKITSAGQYLVGDASNFETVYIPFGADWAQGYKYIYTLVFGKGTGAFDEDGDPLDTMLPISYTVSAINGWTSSTPGAIEF